MKHRPTSPATGQLLDTIDLTCTKETYHPVIQDGKALLCAIVRLHGDVPPQLPLSEEASRADLATAAHGCTAKRRRTGTEDAHLKSGSAGLAAVAAAFNTLACCRAPTV